jgi:pantoate--beta-alanine ligase
MHLITTIAEMQRLARDIRARGRSLALVPTMGALHEGHLSLVRQAKHQCDATVVSIFVNSRQFESDEDLARYPKDLEKDVETLRPFAVDAVFAPQEAEMYPPGFTISVDPGEVARPLEGALRPGHFRGVATVVLKLFNIVRPDVAYFGQKDFQQTLVIRRLVEDLNLDVRLVVCPVVRDLDGMAVSSRNVRLSPQERRAALVLSASLRRAEECVHAGDSEARRVRAEIEQLIAREESVQLEYAAIVDPARLQPVERITPGAVALVAARVGEVRLIDNLILGPPGTAPHLLLQLAWTAKPVVDAQALIPGFETEAVRRYIAACRECAAISTIRLPPVEFLAKHVKSTYRDRNTPRVAVVGRDSPSHPAHYLYNQPEDLNRFVTGLYALLGIEHFEQFKSKFVLTDAVRCHSTGPHVAQKALAYCARHLLEELKLFPSLDTLVILGEDAYLQFQRFVLERGEREIKPFDELLGEPGWAREAVRVAAINDRVLRVFYCHHPTYGYKRSPSLAAFLAE